MAVTINDIVHIPISNENIRWAATTAILKFPYTSQGFANGRPILDNLFQGDLAKNALITYLMHRGFNITNEYDRVRTDNFTLHNPQGYDFSQNDLRVEVNSSKVPHLNRDLAYRLRWYDLKVTAYDNYNNVTMPLDLPYDIAYQLYFETDVNYVPRNYANLLTAVNTVFEDGILYNENVLNALIDQLIVDLEVDDRYTNTLSGYAKTTPQDIENIRLNNQNNRQSQTWNHGRGVRNYWNCKLQDCVPMP
ncbi:MULTISPECIES: hypothetical protein [Bacillus cereus group]|uniref:Uncharacterized protein n=1 Tax=Bacillus cereus (strain AH187) TaxID=405534 RepID=B7HW68_BACC7|nr:MULTISPECIES: hypothetical protein [Bacillus cereus group]ACJ82145.1 hypothetical protein BCAH187_A5301 [Bacillus cereus AH187]EEK97934.1 hypothetical protein bcere0013_49620 [Bacillus cereus BDRD-ST26]KFK76092.1 hypothetical protein DJ87_4706 [Bacillus cereus]KXI88419.1 hypothetical protein ACS46_22550 [Bacillus cereus]MBE7111619.1 hypothetical protein [Bacillus paranthracis]